MMDAASSGALYVAAGFTSGAANIIVGFPFDTVKGNLWT